jgi:hypothetical protein
MGRSSSFAGQRATGLGVAAAGTADNAYDGGAGLQARSTKAFLTALVALTAMTASPVMAGPATDSAYTIGSYPVDAEAHDAVRAKEKALADGQRAAFRALLKRIVPVTAYARLKNVSGASASGLADGYAVRSERHSSTRYIASLDFSFRAQGVRDLLRREGVPFVDTQAPPVTLVPVLREGDKLEAGRWLEAWKGLDLEHTVTPLKVAALKPEITADKLRIMTDGKADGSRLLADAYNNDLVLLAVADVDRATNKLVITFTGNDAVGPMTWKRSHRIFADDVDYTMELASVVGLGVIEGRWKAVQARAAGGVDALAAPGEAFELQVEFSGLAQWNDIRRRILNLRGVDDVRIGAITARGADMSLRYPGGAGRLAEVLAAQGMTLRNAGGAWVLRSSF